MKQYGHDSKVERKGRAGVACLWSEGYSMNVPEWLSQRQPQSQS